LSPESATVFLFERLAFSRSIASLPDLAEAFLAEVCRLAQLDIFPGDVRISAVSAGPFFPQRASKGHLF